MKNRNIFGLLRLKILQKATGMPLQPFHTRKASTSQIVSVRRTRPRPAQMPGEISANPGQNGASGRSPCAVSLLVPIARKLLTRMGQLSVIASKYLEEASRLRWPVDGLRRKMAQWSIGRRIIASDLQPPVRPQPRRHDRRHMLAAAPRSHIRRRLRDERLGLKEPDCGGGRCAIQRTVVEAHSVAW